LVTADNSREINLYSLQTGELNKTVYSKTYGVYSVQFTHHSDAIVYATDEKEHAIRLHCLHDNKYLRFFKGHKDRIVNISMSPSTDNCFA
jgi:COMPASS component SWD2